MMSESSIRIAETASRPLTQRSYWPRWIWASIAAITLIDIAWLAITPITLSPSSTYTVLRLIFCIPLGLWLAHKLRNHPRLHTVITGGTILLAAWPALRVFNHLTMTIPFPLADAWLAYLDGIIRFDWLAYVLWLDQHPHLILIMSLLYGSLTHYSIILFLLLAASEDAPTRCSEFFSLFLLTSMICMIIGMFFPAQSAIIYYDPPENIFQFITGRPEAYHLEALHDLRTNSAAVLDLRSLPGLVTFPSFHTAMGVIAIYCTRHDPVLFGLSATVNLIMIASTPLFGAHYGIDIIAGAAVACAAACLLRHFRSRSSAPMTRYVVNTTIAEAFPHKSQEPTT